LESLGDKELLNCWVDGDYEEEKPRGMIISGKGIPGEEGFELTQIGMYRSPNGKYFANHPIDNNGKAITFKKSRSKYHK